MGKVRAKHLLGRAKDEALFAADLFNARGETPYLDAFIVHMEIAWTDLLAAVFERDNVPERKTWDLLQSANVYFSDAADPVKQNLLFFIGLREKIEQRFSAKVRRALGTHVAGRSQALIGNFEHVLVREFGAENSLAAELRFPLFLSSMTPEAAETVKSARRLIPKTLHNYIAEFDANLPRETRDDQAYEFRVLLVPVLSSKTDADTAITFVDERTLTDEQRAALEKVTVIFRDRLTEVVGAERFRVGQVVSLVRTRVPSFSIAHHTDAWRFFKVRPRGGDRYPERTETRYCIYDVAFKAYTYTQAWVDRLIAELSVPDPAAVLAHWYAATAPVPKGDATAP